MTLTEAFLYGLTQGLTEYLPISSSAHLILLPLFLGTQDPGLSFDIWIHAGTLAATLIYFWRDWARILIEWKTSRLFRAIALATLPALAFGAAFHGLIETTLRSPPIQAGALAVGGILLWGVDRFFKQEKNIDQMTLISAFKVGLGQCLALIPGFSRSGSTIMVGRALGFDRASAARFSFLLSAPVTGAALLFDLKKSGLHFDLPPGVSAQAVGLAAGSAFVFGLIAIGGLLRVLNKFGYGVFAFYRVALAAGILFKTSMFL